MFLMRGSCRSPGQYTNRVNIITTVLGQVEDVPDEGLLQESWPISNRVNIFTTVLGQIEDVPDEGPLQESWPIYKQS